MVIADIIATNMADAGNKSDDHYKLKLSPIRYKLRAVCLPWVQRETPVLNRIQQALLCRPLDIYFSWTANLASHTFYVIMLPLPFWFGLVDITRDLVWVLGLGIYLSGCCKDYFCLPRPRSPPLHRITMSGYTAKEYGFPSSHSANATSVTLVLVSYYFNGPYHRMTAAQNLVICLFIFVYYFSLIFGRIYCGMHGFLDILVGSLIGVFCFLFRNIVGRHWDSLLLNLEYGNVLIPLSIVSAIVLCVHFHAQPVDDCPCFDDSVAFLGVLLGLDLTHYYFARWGFTKQIVNTNFGIDTSVTVPFDYNSLGFAKAALRVLMGITLVVVWKTFSKKILLRILPPIYSQIGFYIPRNYFRPVSKSTESYSTIYNSSIKRLDNDEVADIPKFVKNIARRPEIVDKQGPDSMADVYELINSNQTEQQSHKDKKEQKIETSSCGAFKPRYDVEIVARLIIYSGIAWCATMGFYIMCKTFGLDYNPYRDHRLVKEYL